MSLIEALLILLFLSRILGEIAERYGQSAMLAEIAAGVLVGPSVLNLVHYTPEIKALADLGVLLLVFLTGMEIELGGLWRAFRGRGSWVSVSGFVVPLLMGILLGFAFGLGPTRMVFLGLCIAITALPVSVRILMDLGKLQTGIGQKIISAAVVNDVASLLALGVILDVKGAGTTQGLFGALGISLGKIVIFMGAILLVSRLIRRYTPKPFRRSAHPVERVVAKLKGKESMFAVAFLFVIAFAGFAEFLGLDFIVGAFFGSILLTNAVLGRANFEEVQKTAFNVTMGFLGPIFFAAIGLQFDSSSLRDWKLVIAVLLVAFAGKILGGYLGGRLAGMTGEESWALGIGLNGRGVMELVIANIALSNAFIGQQLFTILVLMAVVTTFCTPFLLKRAYRRLPASAESSDLVAVSQTAQNRFSD
ncbi:MAG TPA: cation:proton antiporter [Candidatus Dormibacteraeota bacterium]|nr:cation:proton antiporter [Candidatus Dormibacteraeota bacterium]